MSPYKVCIVGVGFVGLTLAMSLTRIGIEVIGLDSNEELVDSLNKGYTSIKEPNLNELLKNAIDAGLFRAISSQKMDHHHKRLEQCNVFIVTVGTPLKKGKPDLEHFYSSMREIGKFVAEGDLVIVRSTVAIGATRKALHFLKNQDFAKNVHVAVCPERTIEGDALNELLLLPQIVGGLDQASCSRAVDFFSSIGISCVIVTSLESAELTKLANNTFRDLMFAFANEVTALANSIGISSNEVIEAANRNYPRSNIAKPGPSGGPCLEKDPWILYHSGLDYGIEVKLARSAREINESLVLEFIRKAITRCGNIGKVAILGIAFKSQPETLDMRGSFIFPVLEEVKTLFPRATIFGYEPSGFTGIAHKGIQEANSLSEAVVEADLIILLNQHESFKSIPEMIAGKNREVFVVDLWNSFETRDKKMIILRWGG